MGTEFTPDAIIVGTGLAGLVTAAELIGAGRKVMLIDQENRDNLGGQAYWSMGGLLLVDTPEQRQLGIKDSHELTMMDWLGSAAFDRDIDDQWARPWAEAYVRFAGTSARDYLLGYGLELLPSVLFGERGDGTAGGHGNSVPRFHVVKGAGPELVRAIAAPVLAAERRGHAIIHFRHRVDGISLENGRAVGVHGSVLEESEAERGGLSNRRVQRNFTLRCPNIVVAAGGMGGNVDMIRENWPTQTLGAVPELMLSGAPAHVDGRMLKISEQAGAHLVNHDRSWIYPEGLHNWDPVWPNHGVRLMAGLSSLWLDANGSRLPPMNLPGHSARGSLKAILSTGHDHSWLILTKTILDHEIGLAGSSHNPHLTKLEPAVPGTATAAADQAGPLQQFVENGVDFLVANTTTGLAEQMNRLSRNGARIRPEQLERILHERDSQLNNATTKDLQLTIAAAIRSQPGSHNVRLAEPHRFLDPVHGPLIAVRLNVMTRKSLGGIKTNLSSRALTPTNEQMPGLYVVGEAAGFGGGGMHGYNALEGGFLGGCLFSGLAAAQDIVRR